jgi:hypothetical protein
VVAVEATHETAVIHDRDDEYHVFTPMEVCLTCSDPDAGNWVPVSFCTAPQRDVMERRLSTAVAHYKEQRGLS